MAADDRLPDLAEDARDGDGGGRHGQVIAQHQTVGDDDRLPDEQSGEQPAPHAG